MLLGDDHWRNISTVLLVKESQGLLVRLRSFLELFETTALLSTFFVFRPIALMATLTTAIACVLMFIRMMLDIEGAKNETMQYLERVENGGR